MSRAPRPHGITPAALARLQDRLPDPIGRLRRDENLEAVLAGVAGARHGGADVGHLPVREPVVLHRGEIDADERLKDLERRRALQREQRVSRGRIDGHGVAGSGDVPGDPGVVLLNVAGVDDEEEVRGGQAVDEQVVDKRALRRQQARILRLPDLQLRGVVARDALHRRQRVPAGDLDLAHVADVEEAGARAHGHVLVGDARILDRHVPAAERTHLGAGAAMAGVERRLLERRGGGLFHEEQRRVTETGNGTMGVRMRSRTPELVRPQSEDGAAEYSCRADRCRECQDDGPEISWPRPREHNGRPGDRACP